MEGYFPLKLKRKDLEDVSDDFSDFSLSSPARKIRRLDAELPPIIEEEECEIPTAFDNPLCQQQRFDHNSSGGLMIEELPTEPINKERAIVLFKPTNTTPFLQSPSNFSLSVSPELLSRFRNEVLWSSQSNSFTLGDEEEVDNSNSSSRNGCLAVVPWVPAQHCSASTRNAEFPSQNNSEMMDDQEVEEATMDVDADNEHQNVDESGGMSLGEGFHQWQQQHCLIPQPPQNGTAPIVWYQ